MIMDSWLCLFSWEIHGDMVVSMGEDVEPTDPDGELSRVEQNRRSCSCEQREN
jgi:hypothetical protein